MDPLIDDAVRLLACMANPTRLGVLRWLVERGPAPVGELCGALGVEQTAMSHHLRSLRDARLVSGTRSGRHVVYAVQDAHVAAIVRDTLSHAAERRGGRP